LTAKNRLSRQKAQTVIAVLPYPATPPTDRIIRRRCGPARWEIAVDAGQISLEAPDWIVDTKGERLIGNPEHGGEWGLDAF
jgi:hypothetical protein